MALVTRRKQNPSDGIQVLQPARCGKRRETTAVTMNVLLDCGAIKEGGGVQLALNFLDALERDPPPGVKITILVPDGGQLRDAVRKRADTTVLFLPQPYVSRLWFETFSLPRLLKNHAIDVIFTFFGAGLPHPRSVKSVVTVAYPIICYPESPFWRYLGKPDRLWNWFRNKVRVRRLRQADLVLAETEIMARRLAAHAGVPSGKIRILPPAVSGYVTQRRPAPATTGAPARFLFVSGVALHKNLWRLQEVARELQRRGQTGAQIRFLLTVDEAAFKSVLREGADEELIREYFEFLGPIPPTAIQRPYEAASFLVTLSDLESFSNNYMEAWCVGVPIIASDRDFARSICGPSAVYVEPHDPRAISDLLVSCATDEDLARSLVAAGRERLERLPDTRQRVRLILSYLESVVGRPAGAVATPAD